MSLMIAFTPCLPSGGAAPGNARLTAVRGQAGAGRGGRHSGQFTSVGEIVSRGGSGGAGGPGGARNRKRPTRRPRITVSCGPGAASVLSPALLVEVPGAGRAGLVGLPVAAAVDVEAGQPAVGVVGA